VAAVTGHNWSCFLKFAGGRGVGTFIGAALALAPEILGFSLIPFVLLALIWNAAIGTFLLFLALIFISVYFSQFEIAGIFSILSMVPIWIKRLSPVKELSFKNRGLIRNRLIFDNDQPCLDLRIKRIFNRLTKK
jgi:glycerol-3-phosphate acyltransferase PlsY